jgi:ribosomal protein S18 acetylase RimI-like enzyme
VEIRQATSADLPALRAIEAAADTTYERLFGELDWPEPSAGEWRARQPGFLVVAGEPAYGFAHVLVIGGHAHLEQLAVRPEHQQRGVGTALVRAVLQRAGNEGHSRLTLSTYADVPWNAPFYRRLGFEVVERLTPFERELQEREEAMGLMRYGDRVVMQVALPSQVTDE